MSAMSANTEEADNLSIQRRRLSVTSTNKFVDGVEKLSLGSSPLKRRGSVPIREGELGSHIERAYGVSKKGYAPYNPRKQNQDALVMIEDSETGTQAILVLDGHGEMGEKISGYFEERFCEEVFGHPDWPVSVGGMKRAIGLTIEKLEAELIADQEVDTEFSGTTFVFSALRNGELLVANVGDSRITLARMEEGALTAVPISIDHKPDEPAEKARILAAGGRVFAVEHDDGIDGPARVWLGHMDVPGLAMSRSLGDEVAHSAGVTSEPEFFVRTIDAADRFVVSASDGLWEFLTDEEVVAMVAQHTRDGAASAVRETVEKLVEESNARWMKEEQVIDDTTVAIAFLNSKLLTNPNAPPADH